VAAAWVIWVRAGAMGRTANAMGGALIPHTARAGLATRAKTVAGRGVVGRGGSLCV